MSIEAVRFAIEQGNIIYHADKAAACVEHLKAASCAGLFAARTPDPACAEVFEGKRPEGEACTLSAECAGEGARCASGTSGSSACTLGLREGESCDRLGVVTYLNTD